MARKSVGGKAPRRQLVVRVARGVWHPALTTAAEEGEEHLEAALDADVEEDGELLYQTSGQASCLHPASQQPGGLPVAEVPASPFPPHSSFGIVPYAVWHGHHAVVKSYLELLGADVDETAMVRCVPGQRDPLVHGQRQQPGTCPSTCPPLPLRPPPLRHFPAVPIGTAAMPHATKSERLTHCAGAYGATPGAWSRRRPLCGTGHDSHCGSAGVADCGVEGKVCAAAWYGGACGRCCFAPLEA